MAGEGQQVAVLTVAALLGALVFAGSPAAQTVPEGALPSRLEAQSAVPPEAQVPSQTCVPAGSPPAPAGPRETIDVFDLIRKIRHRELTEQAQLAAEDPAHPMYAFAPVIGYKPSSGGLFGFAGNVAFFRGDPKTTHISSAVAAVTFSSLKQASAAARFGVFTRNDRWKLDGDNRFQWTSQDTFGLGTETTAADKVNLEFDYFRVYETVYRAFRPGVFAGIGFHYSAHTGIGPGEGAEADWSESPYVTYSEEHGLPLESQTSAGTSLNVLVDTRDSAINADRGWLGSVSYRTFFSGFLGGDSTWQELTLDARIYRTLSSDGRHKLAFWALGDFVVAGVAPFLDLPATGMDTYGRSGRGYTEGRFRGERLLYGELEYRGTLTRNGLLGMGAFLNTSTLANRQAGEYLFDHFASAGGVGLRLLINKRSKTNLCLDVAWGQQGSHGLYLSVQEAF
jgi:hypothetical protein